jgi:integrase
MASIRERIDANGKKSYHVQIRIRGFPPQTQTFDNKTEGKYWAARIETEIRAGRYMPHAVSQRHTMRELLQDYKSKVLIPFKPKEARTQGPQIDWWIEKLGNYSLADITPSAIAKCRDELLTTPIGKKRDKLRAPATVVRYLAGLSQAFNVAVNEWQWMPESPMAKVTKPKVNNERLRHLSADELSRLLEAAKLSANEYLHTILVLALSTGMRHGEIMELRWVDVLFEDDEQIGLILLQKTKNGDRRGVPLVRNAFDALKALRTTHAKTNNGRIDNTALLFPSDEKPSKEKPTQPVEIRKAWETTLKRAKVEDFHFHDLRHTAASYLAMEGATAPEIAEILGHKSLQMVKRYSHFTKAHITKLMTRMNESRLEGKPKATGQHEGAAGGSDDGQ